MLFIIGLCAVILWQIYLALDADGNYLGVVTSNSKLGQYNSYAVATDAQPCAKVGKNLLAKGGHAVDAAIGTLICMGVALPNSLGLGGGCLMTIYDNQTKTAITVDGREIAPDYATETMFANNSLAASRGPLSVGIPGELAAYWEAHRRFGKLQWSELFDESIEMAELGMPMVEHLSFAFRDWTHAQYITQPLRDIFWNEQTNDYFKEGETVRQPALAKTLKRIRDNGVQEFYDGLTGHLFVEDLKKQGGKITMANLKKYKPLVKPALDVKIDDDLRLYTQSMPGSGVVLSLIMRVMKELGYFKNLGTHDSYQAASLFYHHLAEAFKFAYAQRAGLEDNPDDGRMTELMNKLLSDEFVQQIAAKIDNQTHPTDYYGGAQYFQEDHGTAHTSVIDSMGNSVAVTTSVNLYFGSGLVSPTTGIIYNDVMDDFVSPGVSNKFMLPPSKYNRIKPGRRPLSSMAPSVFVNGHGDPILIVGASGGAKITTAVATVALRNIFLAEDVKAAIDAPRIHHQYLPDNVWFESNFPAELLESLKLRGHKLQQITGRSSVVMAVACNYLDQSGHDLGGPRALNTSASGASRRTTTTKIITANSDYRKGGTVDGL